MKLVTEAQYLALASLRNGKWHYGNCLLAAPGTLSALKFRGFVLARYQGNLTIRANDWRITKDGRAALAAYEAHHDMGEPNAG